MPDATLWGPDGVAESAFTNDVPADVATHVYLTVATINPKDYGPKGQKFFRDFRSTYKSKVIQPYAIYGYEAMDVVLDSMQRAGSKCNDRQAVIDQFFATKNHEGVTGTFDVDKDGDVTSRQFGRHVVVKGELSPIRTVTVERDSFGRPLG
jgi:branched-chain amino acid transport system substrate-binding protein